MEILETLPHLPERPADGNKGTFGRVLVVGGQEGMVGAPVMAGTAALRMGAGLVQIATPRTILSAAITITPELIGFPLRKSGGLRELKTAAEKANALVIGPGMGQEPPARRRLMRLLRLETPTVIDADALNILASLERWPEEITSHAVMTPHPGEMKRLGSLIGRDEVPTDDAGRLDIASQASIAFGQVIVLKGTRTVVTDGQRAYVNHTGDSSLAKAGTGDVLSGMIAALLAQKMDRFEAACLAVYLHGKAGEAAGQAIGKRSVLAMDVVDSIPEVLRSYEGV